MNTDEKVRQDVSNGGDNAMEEDNEDNAAEMDHETNPIQEPQTDEKQEVCVFLYVVFLTALSFVLPFSFSFLYLLWRSSHCTMRPLSSLIVMLLPSTLYCQATKSK